MFVSSPTPFGAIMGAIYSTAAATLVAFWDVFTGKAGVSFLWMMPVSLAVSLAAGTASACCPPGEIYRVLAAYSVGWLGLLAALVALVVRNSA